MVYCMLLTVSFLTVAEMAMAGHLSVSANLQSCNYTIKNKPNGTPCYLDKHAFCSPVFKVCVHTDLQSMCATPIQRNFQIKRLEQEPPSMMIPQITSNAVNISTEIYNEESLDEATLDIEVFNEDDQDKNIIDRFVYPLTKRKNALRSGTEMKWINIYKRSLRGSMEIEFSFTASYNRSNYTGKNNKNMREKVSSYPPAAREEREKYPEWVQFTCFMATSIFRKDICLKMGVQWREITSYEKNLNSYEPDLFNLFRIFG
ncbi:unnamed protein product [Heterobilharzia americana]|nr:unnamed protein product [Heterobilharzia americana]